MAPVIIDQRSPVDEANSKSSPNKCGQISLLLSYCPILRSTYMHAAALINLLLFVAQYSTTIDIGNVLSDDSTTLTLAHSTLALKPKSVIL